MKKYLLFFVFIVSFCSENLAQYRICPEAIAFPVMSGCAINALQESDCIRMGSTIYSNTHQSLVTYNGSSWTLSNGTPLSPSSPSLSNTQYLTLGTQAQDKAAGFGYSAAISDRYAVVSAPFFQHPSGYYGSIYVYKKNNLGNWTQIAIIENNSTNHYTIPYNSAYASWFGRSVDISGNNIIVGSYPPYTIYDEGGQIDFFSIDPATDVVSFQNTFFNQTPGADFGFGVKISGNYAIAPERPLVNYVCSSTSPNLKLRIYKKTGNSWALNTTFTVGKDIAGASIDGDLISLAQTTSACVVNLITYKLTGTIWSPYLSLLNIGFTPISGSIYRCGANVSLLYTKRAGNSGATYGSHFKLNTTTNSISTAKIYNDYVFTNSNIPAFPSGVSLTYEGFDVTGYEIAGIGANGYLRFIDNQTSTFPSINTFQMASHNNRPVVIDAENGNLIYCSNPSLSSNNDDWKVLIGKIF
jgi:hypothetical protein